MLTSSISFNNLKIYLALTISFIIPTGNAPEPTAGSITLTFLSKLSSSSEFSLIDSEINPVNCFPLYFLPSS